MQLLNLSKDLVARLQKMPGIHPSHYQALSEYLAQADLLATEEEISAARENYAAGSDDGIEIDDVALVSRAEEGTWVQAWVWLPLENAA